MAIVVETGTGSATANSYATIAQADAYISLRLYTGWTAIVDAHKEAALVNATDYIEATYRDAWQGYRVSSTQALSWPRSTVVVDTFPVAANIVPAAVIQACIEMAYRSGTGSVLIEDQGQLVVREKVDVIETEYAQFSDPAQKYPFVSKLLAPYLLSANVGGSFSQVRTLRT
jgi:hypothetical protein